MDRRNRGSARTTDYRRPRVFIDADALIAGSASTTGASNIILRLGELGLIDLFSSAQVMREAERNVAGKLPQALSAFRALARVACAWLDDPDPAALAVVLGMADPQDLPILAAAVKAKCQWLGTVNTPDLPPHPPIIPV